MLNAKLEAAILVLGPLHFTENSVVMVKKQNKTKLEYTQKTESACEFFVVRIEAPMIASLLNLLEK